ncbi:MAG: multiheme c-type cytochrome [Gammaproteobacteria bacterium]|nr:multiheme c-type cytochrome [Gammaproteobacteria bacterium]
MRRKSIIAAVLGIAIFSYLGWRLVRPLEIFSVSKRFEYPLSTRRVPPPLASLSAAACGTCHTAIYREWSTSMHAHAWTDPYFQTDYRADGSRQICLNCHTPLDRQQKFKVLGFHGADHWDPVLAPNPQFEPALQRQGVSCAACHVRHGVVYGPFAGIHAPHPVARWGNDNEACVRCHVVNNRHRDVFYRLPPCGTVAEIHATQKRVASGTRVAGLAPQIPKPPAPVYPGADGYGAGVTARGAGTLGCVQCHMPSVDRPLVPGGPVLPGRRHLWRGGHDPRMVAAALRITFAPAAAPAPGQRRYVLTITDTGAEHDIPTGVPDRHLTVDLRVLDAAGHILRSQSHRLERHILWRPFIVELRDTRLQPGQPRRYSIRFAIRSRPRPASVEAVVRYWLMDPSHRAQLHYHGLVSYVVYRKLIPLTVVAAGGGSS